MVKKVPALYELRLMGIPTLPAREVKRSCKGVALPIRERLCLVAALLCLWGLPAQAQEEEDWEDYLDIGAEDRGITLTGTEETTQQMKVIDQEEIARRNAQDLASLLEDVLDIGVTRYGAYGNQTELNMRGFDTERIAILIDGVPANSPRSGDFDVSQVDLHQVERIEVIYGGSDTKYNLSGALGGVINIITVKRQEPGLTVNGTLTNTGYLPGPYVRRHAGGARGEPQVEDLVDLQSLSLGAGYGTKAFSLKTSLFGNRAGNHYLYQDDYGFARRKESNEILDLGGGASLMWTLPKDATLVSDTKAYYAHKNFPITPNSVGFALAEDLQLSEHLLFNAPVFLREDLSSEASLSYQFSQTHYGVDYESRDHALWGLYRVGFYPSQRWTFRAGGDWRFLYIHTQSLTETEGEKTGNQGGLYVTGEYAPVRTVLLIASVKGVTDTKHAAVIPKLGLRWEALPSLVVKHNYFRSFKFPDFDDLYYRSLDSMFVGNPALRPEDGLGVDLSGEWTVQDRFMLTGTLYGQWTEDSIHWIKSAGGRWSPENIGTAFLFGAEARPEVRLAINRGGFTALILGLTYQYQLSWLLSGEADFADSYRIPYMPTQRLGASVDLRWKTGSLLLSGHYETTRYGDTLNQLVLKPYGIVHLTVNQQVGKGLTLFGVVRNMLNAHYESFAGYYMPGLSFSLGLRTRLPLASGTGHE
ncbi:MAG: TonB-dependent receptor [Spirochaetaceae bacterium]|jgi:vitamin B12 transporter|nr:TonB-dependent receptor [Spirochaetaceae bacterium]